MDERMYQTSKIIELSVSAARVNKGYIKSSTGSVYSNKDLMRFTLSSELERSYVPDDFVPLEFTDEDGVQLEKINKHMRRYMLMSLGNLSAFQSDVFVHYNSETIPSNRFGFIAYLPFFVERDLKELAYTQRLKKEFSDSRHLTEFKSLEGKVEVLKVIHLNKAEYETYLYFVGFDKNLLIFANKNKFETGDFLEMRGKVKSFQEEMQTKTPVTRLNYVNIKKRITENV